MWPAPTTPRPRALPSVYAADNGVPRTLRLKKHHVDLAFAVTDFKVQGKTLDYFVLSIGPRSTRPALKLVDLYVLVSRVRLGRNLYVIGLDPSNPSDLEHLRRLRPSAELAVWERGYGPDGFWDDGRAQRAAAELVQRLVRRRRPRR